MSERTVGFPRLHLRRVDSTNLRARELAAAGAPDGMVVTATRQESGRGRQGRTWVAPAGRALLCSLLIREPPRDDGPTRRISLRSSHDEVDVSAIAREQGGGGHRQAAGFSSELPIPEIVEFIHREFAKLAAAGA